MEGALKEVVLAGEVTCMREEGCEMERGGSVGERQAYRKRRERSKAEEERELRLGEGQTI